MNTTLYRTTSSKKPFIIVVSDSTGKVIDTRKRETIEIARRDAQYFANQYSRGYYSDRSREFYKS